jgi:hypothetical protein
MLSKAAPGLAHSASDEAALSFSATLSRSICRNTCFICTRCLKLNFGFSNHQNGYSCRASVCIGEQVWLYSPHEDSFLISSQIQELVNDATGSSTKDERATGYGLRRCNLSKTLQM